MVDRVWLSYDLGVDGDYEGLYQWLDTQKAVECGDGCASFRYDSGNVPIARKILADVKRAMTLRARDRLYLIFRDSQKQGKWFGKFIQGGRKAAPWAGHAVAGEAAADEE